jgi:hypothetical protein
MRSAPWPLAGLVWKLRFIGRWPAREKLRDFGLGRMPPGGVCAEIGVSHGNFSASIRAINRPRRLDLIDPWVSHPELEESARTRCAGEIGAGTVEVLHSTCEAATE